MSSPSCFCGKCGFITYDGPQRYCAYCWEDPTLTVKESCYQCEIEPSVQGGLCDDCAYDSYWNSHRGRKDSWVEYERESEDLPDDMGWEICPLCCTQYLLPGQKYCSSCEWEDEEVAESGYRAYYGTAIPSVEEEMETIMVTR